MDIGLLQRAHPSGRFAAQYRPRGGLSHLQRRQRRGICQWEFHHRLCAHGGRCMIRLPRPARVIDLMENTTLSTGKMEFKLTMPAIPPGFWRLNDTLLQERARHPA